MHNKYILKKSFFILSAIFILNSCSLQKQFNSKRTSVYYVARQNKPIMIDSNWNKSEWKVIKSLNISNVLGLKPKFNPITNVKLSYDFKNLYLIYQIKDKFVKCLKTELNTYVYDDAAVEIFFAPDEKNPLKYFNLEMNCGGTALMWYVTIPRKEHEALEIDDLKKIEIAHSLPKVIENEITDSITWTLECKIPLSVLEKYGVVTKPKKGVTWRANFYKIANTTSNPHYISWSLIENGKIDFHQPQYFGKLIFQ